MTLKSLWQTPDWTIRAERSPRVLRANFEPFPHSQLVYVKDDPLRPTLISACVYFL